MRVIAGRAGGLGLASVSGQRTRPTLDRVRESVFAILTPWLAGARVLDLYAGTGALGIEALSRGAASCDFVEVSPEALRVLRRNLVTTGLEALASVHRLRLPQGLRRLEAPPHTMVFADPPYGLSPWRQLWPELTPRLAAGGIVVCEHGRAQELPPGDALRLFRRREYGQTSVSFLRRDGG